MNTNHKFASDRIFIYFQKELKTNKGSKYILLYKAIKSCILNMELPFGWTLPSTRSLAEDLLVSRTTVLKTYELLVLEKIIQAKPGSGYKTNFSLDTSAQKEINPFKYCEFKYPEISEKGRSYVKNVTLINRDENDILAFRPGLPPMDVFPINQWKNLLNSYWRYVKSSGLGYSQSSGMSELKNAICSYLNISRNIKCNPDQIVIVSGSLQSLYLIVNTLINKDDAVVVENPLFPNVHSIFKSSQATVIPLSLDAEGIDLASFSNSNSGQPKLIHVTPSNHYPLGVKMSLSRRLELLNWASEQGALVIENDYENEIANAAAAIPSVFALDQEDRTIYMGTFNRLLHPSIRLGYMIVPRYLRPVVDALQEHSHRFVPPSIQLVMQQFIDKNYLYQHIKNCINIAEERFVLFQSEFSKHVKNMTLLQTEFSSFHVTALFNKPTIAKEEQEVIQKLNAVGIKAFSLSKCYIGQPEKTGLILGYSAVRPSLMKQKIERMGAVI